MAKMGAVASASVCALVGGVVLAQYIFTMKKKTGRKTKIIEMVRGKRPRAGDAGEAGAPPPPAARPSPPPPQGGASPVGLLPTAAPVDAGGYPPPPQGAGGPTHAALTYQPPPRESLLPHVGAPQVPLPAVRLLALADG